MKTTILSTLFATFALFSAQARENEPSITVTPTGTVRTKFEWQPSEGNARFDVRTARFGVGGAIHSRLNYKIEIDLSDEGRMKMVDAYVGGRIYKGFSANIGFMRVPFTIDAHRSPHLQLFANRSFIAKQVGNVRDVGATLGWQGGTKIPLNIQIGMFNGSGLIDDLKTYWTNQFNYSAKLQAGLAPGLNFVTGYQTTRPDAVRIHMFNAGLTWQSDRWLAEVEYLHKSYEKYWSSIVASPGLGGVGGSSEQWSGPGQPLTKAAGSIDAFASYSIPLAKGPFRHISLLGRYDWIADHSSGVANSAGWLIVNDPERHRATAGLTFSLAGPYMADIRLNYEKYFYRRGATVTPGPSDHDKIVVELMAHF